MHAGTHQKIMLHMVSTVVWPLKTASPHVTVCSLYTHVCESEIQVIQISRIESLGSRQAKQSVRTVVGLSMNRKARMKDRGNMGWLL